MIEEVTYLSFADDQGSRGVVVLSGGIEVVAAIHEARRLGINPGGEVMCLIFRRNDNLPDGAFEKLLDNSGRLIPPEEAKILFDGKTLAEIEDE